jgi:hypothetical protein
MLYLNSYISKNKLNAKLQKERHNKIRAEINEVETKNPQTISKQKAGS